MRCGSERKKEDLTELLVYKFHSQNQYVERPVGRRLFNLIDTYSALTLFSRHKMIQ